MLIAILILVIMIFTFLLFISMSLIWLLKEDNKKIIAKRKKIAAKELKAADLIKCDLEELTTAYLFLSGKKGDN